MIACMRPTPLWFAATCYRPQESHSDLVHMNLSYGRTALTALRSLSTSLIFLHPELPGYRAGFSTIYSKRPFLSNTPSSTSLKLTISAPSSARFTDVGGMLPGKIPPMSAWCPREAVKKMISPLSLWKTGVMMVISGK